MLERALAIRERSLGPQHRDVARTLADLASTLSDVGRPARAQTLAIRAVEIWERLGAPDAPEFATVLALYAKLQATRGDGAAARAYYERALAIRARTFGTSHPLYAEAQAGLAVALAATGDRAAALEAALAAETTGRDHLRVMLRSLPERQGLNYAAARPRGQDLILSLSGSPPEAIPAALDEVIRSRALVLDEIAARQGAAHAASDRERPARAALTAAQQRLANLTVRGPGPLSPAQYAAVLDEARQESEQAEQALAEVSGDFSQQRRRDQVGLDAVAAALSPDTALVSLVRYDRQVFTPPSGASSVDRAARRALRTVPSYLAFVVRSSGTPAAVPLGPAAALEALVAQWRLDIREEAIAPLEPSETPARSSRTSGLAVRRLVWDRLRPLLGDARTVFIVPDGVLSLVPFAALPTGARSYLLETGPVIHYLSAERDLVAPPPPGNRGRGLLAVGGPSFNDRTALRATVPALITPPSNSPAPVMRGTSSACGSLQSVRFEPLTGTLQEIRDLSRLWDRYAALDTTADAARVFTGRGATETAFKREARRYRVLHLATHGFFLSTPARPRRPAPAASVAWPGRHTPRREPAAPVGPRPGRRQPSRASSSERRRRHSHRGRSRVARSPRRRVGRALRLRHRRRRDQSR